MAVVRFIKKNVVFCVAALAELTTACFVPPDAAYLTYFDWRTLTADGCHPNPDGSRWLSERIPETGFFDRL